MKIIWESGLERNYNVGALLVGLRHRAQRPAYVTLERSELLVLLTDEGRLWACKTLIPALKEPT